MSTSGHTMYTGAIVYTLLRHRFKNVTGTRVGLLKLSRNAGKWGKTWSACGKYETEYP